MFVVVSLLVAQRWNWLGMVRAAGPRGGIVFVGDFEDKSLSRFERSGGGVFEVVDAPTRVGAHAVRLEINLEKGVRGSHRAELVPRSAGAMFRGSYPEFGEEYWYTFSVYLPPNWEIDPARESIAQWHGVPDRLLLEEYRNSALALNVEGDRFVLDTRFDAALVTAGQDTPARERYGGWERHDLGSMRESRGVWVDWLFHVRWSYEPDGSGFVHVWKDGERVLALSGPNCYRDLRGGPYHKLGPYRWVWLEDDAETRPGPRRRELFLDEIRIGHGNLPVHFEPALKPGQ